VDRRNPRTTRRLTLAALAAAAALLLAACSQGATPDAARPDAHYDGPTAAGVAERVTPLYDAFSSAGGGGLTTEPSVWFVAVDAPAFVDGGARVGVASAVDRVQAAAAEAGAAFAPRYVFDTFVSGFSLEADAGALWTIAALPGVRSITPVGLVAGPEVQRHDGPAVPQLITATGMTGADVAQDDFGVTGAGVLVGIIDTGILASHPDFGGRVVTGFDFVGDLYNASDPANATPVPEPGALTRPGGGDCNGHGTHVAGIVGAGGPGLVGVAPGVEFGAYRVFGCEGSSHSDVILAAIEQAYADGMDVVNLSLGSSNGFADDFLAIALGRMAELGMVPVASAGNNGASGTFTIGAPGAGADVIAVASVDNTDFVAPSFLVDGNSVAYDSLDGAPVPPTAGTVGPVVYLGQGCLADEYLDDPDGAVALVTRGACAFAEKYERAVAAGAVGVVIENNAPSLFFGTLGGDYVGAFGVGISGDDGAIVRSLITSGPAPSIEWTDVVVQAANPTGFLASAFSSYGLAPDLSLKPDVAAPGGFINSTYIDGAEPGVPGTAGTAVLSGTSMASPHVAGAVALLLEWDPTLHASEIKGRLQNTADPLWPWALDPSSGLMESAHRQGAGLINVPLSLFSEVRAYPSALSLGESASGVFVDVVTLTNDTGTDVTFGLTQVEAAFGTTPVATFGDPGFPEFAIGYPLVEYFELRDSGFFDPIDTVVVPAGGAATFQVRITAPSGLDDATIHGTYLYFEVLDGDVGAFDMFVPAVGFVGDYQATPLFTDVGGLVLEPFLAFVDGFDVYFLPEGYPFTMRDGDVPAFGFGISYPVDRLYAEIVPQGDRAWMGPQPAFEIEQLSRNDPFTVTTFGLGDFDASALPTGAYTIRVHALRAEGDPTNPAHTVVAETPVFYIDRSLEF